MEDQILPRPLSLKRKQLRFNSRYKNWFPFHYEKFNSMHYYNQIEAFPKTDEGFVNFMKELGIPPISMKNPSLGRIDHTKSYAPGNVVWQEWEYNQAESHFRNNWLIPKGFKSWKELFA